MDLEDLDERDGWGHHDSQEDEREVLSGFEKERQGWAKRYLPDAPRPQPPGERDFEREDKPARQRWPGMGYRAVRDRKYQDRERQRADFEHQQKDERDRQERERRAEQERKEREQKEQEQKERERKEREARKAREAAERQEKKKALSTSRCLGRGCESQPMAFVGERRTRDRFNTTNPTPTDILLGGIL